MILIFFRQDVQDFEKLILELDEQVKDAKPLTLLQSGQNQGLVAQILPDESQNTNLSQWLQKDLGGTFQGKRSLQRLNVKLRDRSIGKIIQKQKRIARQKEYKKLASGVQKNAKKLVQQHVKQALKVGLYHRAAKEASGKPKNDFLNFLENKRKSIDLEFYDQKTALKGQFRKSEGSLGAGKARNELSGTRKKLLKNRKKSSKKTQKRLNSKLDSKSKPEGLMISSVAPETPENGSNQKMQRKGIFSASESDSQIECTERIISHAEEVIKHQIGARKRRNRQKKRSRSGKISGSLDHLNLSKTSGNRTFGGQRTQAHTKKVFSRPKRAQNAKSKKIKSDSISNNFGADLNTPGLKGGQRAKRIPNHALDVFGRAQRTEKSRNREKSILFKKKNKSLEKSHKERSLSSKMRTQRSRPEMNPFLTYINQLTQNKKRANLGVFSSALELQKEGRGLVEAGEGTREPLGSTKKFRKGYLGQQGQVAQNDYLRVKNYNSNPKG